MGDAASSDPSLDTSLAASWPQLARLPHLWPLTCAVLLLGLATSLSMPFMSLFAVREVGMSPWQLGIYLTLNALSAVGVSTRLGRFADRGAHRRRLVSLSLAAGALAYLLLSGVRTVWGVMLVGTLLLSVSSAAFPQLFSFARAALAGAPGEWPERATTLLRAAFSFAWVIGPGLGAALLGAASYHGVFLASALCFVLTGLALQGVPSGATPVAASSSPEEFAAAAPRRALGWIVAAFVLYGVALNMGMTMFPLLITQTLGGSEGQVGFLVGLCALLEIPVMLLFVFSRRLPGTEWLIRASLLLFAVHFGLIYLAQGTALLVVTQALRAAVLAVMAGLGMTYFQQLLPGRFGAATTLYSNTTVVGGMIAGLLAGGWAQLFGYRPVFLLCAGLSLAGWVLMRWATRRPDAC